MHLKPHLYTVITAMGTSSVHLTRESSQSWIGSLRGSATLCRYGLVSSHDVWFCKNSRNTRLNMFVPVGHWVNLTICIWCCKASNYTYTPNQNKSVLKLDLHQLLAVFPHSKSVEKVSLLTIHCHAGRLDLVLQRSQWGVLECLMTSSLGTKEEVKQVGPPCKFQVLQWKEWIEHCCHNNVGRKVDKKRLLFWQVFSAAQSDVYDRYSCYDSFSWVDFGTSDMECDVYWIRVQVIMIPSPSTSAT